MLLLLLQFFFASSCQSWIFGCATVNIYAKIAKRDVV